MPVAQHFRRTITIVLAQCCVLGAIAADSELCQASEDRQTAARSFDAASDGNQAAQASPEEQPSEKKTVDECKLLIEELASKWPEPFEKSVAPDLIGTGIREGDLARRQRPIRRAFDTLNDNMETALPLLVEHASDKRFSYVYESVSGAYVKANIGTACRQLIRDHVLVYSVRPVGGSKIPGEPPYPRRPDFIAECGGVDQWWKPRSEKLLAELQREAIKWAIDVEKQRGFDTVEEEHRILGDLESQLAKIGQSAKPLAVKSRLFFFGK